MIKENINSNLKYLSKRLLKLLAILTMFSFAISFLVFCHSLTAATEDYTAFAKEQEQKTKVIIEPYKAQVDELIKSVEIRQSQSDIQAFKKEVTNICKAQCFNQHQEVSQTAASMQISTSTSTPTPTATPILIFVSFSMPKESLKGWIAQAKKIGASVYIRGLVNNSFKDTTKAVSELIQDQPGGLLIDPTFFKKYFIAEVPAVVVTSDDSFDVVYGDVTLDYALEKLNQGSSKKERQLLLEAIKKLRNKK
jgi:conjugal transfer pilus assembly protein TrbC